MKRAVLAASARLGAPDVLGALWRGRLTVLAYHRVLDVARVPFARDIVSASPEDFARQMRWIARRFDVLGLDEAIALVAGEGPRVRRPALITFDDGYRDNFDNALPVLRALGLPATLFVVTSALGSTWVPWWDRLAQLIRDSPRETADLPIIGRVPLGEPASRERAAGSLARALKGVSEQERVELVGMLPDRLDVEPLVPSTPLFMTWDEARQMDAAGVACQPHTHTHPVLARIGEEASAQEVERSAELIRERIGRPALALAYPHGTPQDISPAIVAAIRRTGIEAAFTTDPGPQGLRDARSDPMRLRRVSIEWEDDMDRFAFKVMGAPVLRQRLRHSLGR